MDKHESGIIKNKDKVKDFIKNIGKRLCKRKPRWC